METKFGSLAAKLDGWQKQMQANQEASKATYLKANPVEMESETEHWEVPMEEAAVKSSGAMKKQHRARHLVAGRRGEPKELT
jgi:hypothetical protein